MKRAWRASACVWRLVGNHDNRVADLEFRVTNLPIWTSHTEAFLRAKCALVEFDRTCGVVHDQIRIDRMKTRRDGSYWIRHKACSSIVRLRKRKCPAPV